MLKNRSKQLLLSEAQRYRVNSSLTDEAILSFLSSLDCPRALTVWLLYSNNEHRQLVDLEVVPADSLDSEDFAASYAATKLLSKAKFLTLDIDTEAAALTTFFEGERKNAETNRRFRNLGALFKERTDAAHIVNSIARKVSQILYCDVNCEKWLDRSSWGPGVTYHLRGDETGPEEKFLLEAGITSKLKDLLMRCWDNEFPGWPVEFADAPGSRTLTTEKNAKTKRTIQAEPGINSFLQLGLGGLMCDCLLRSGIDLTTQDRNQLLAFYGAVAGNLATRDFANASGSIATEFVRTVLPADWFMACDLCRSERTEVLGHLIGLEQFSSMGNGFTFPLETILFLAIALAVCDHVGVDSEYVGVYGDDVVLPVQAVETFDDWCAFCGFTVNRSKSFSTETVFRESCGAHYHRFRDVKPIFIKERLGSLASVYKLANSVRRYAGQGLCFGLDPRFRSTWDLLYNAVPKNLRFHIPEGKGDGGFVVDFDLAVPFVKRAKSWVEGYFYRALSVKPKTGKRGHRGVLLARLCSAGSSSRLMTSRPGMSNDTTYRRRVVATINYRGFVDRWPSRGGWLSS